jgi:hypothetical protein
MRTKTANGGGIREKGAGFCRFALHENRFENVKMAETLGFFLFSRRFVKIDFWTPVKMRVSAIFKCA